MGDFEDNMTVRDAARELGVSKSRVDQFIGDGRLKVVAVAGGLRWVSRKAVAAIKKTPRTSGYPKGRPRQPKPGRPRKEA